MKADLISKDFFMFIKFAIVGVINTLVNWSIFFILNWMEVHYLIANIVAYSIATVNSYIFNSIWVFRYKEENRVNSFIKFIILNIIGLILNTVILFILVDIFSINKIISLVFVTGVIMIFNYIFNKILVFKK